MIKTTLLPGSLLVALLALAPPARADVVVIVSAERKASTLSADQITDIYLGRSSALKPFDTKSPVRAQFYSKVTGKDDAQVRAIWAKLVFTGKASPPKELPDDNAVVKAVAADPEAIGYVDKSAVNTTVKIILEPK